VTFTAFGREVNVVTREGATKTLAAFLAEEKVSSAMGEQKKQADLFRARVSSRPELKALAPSFEGQDDGQVLALVAGEKSPDNVRFLRMKEKEYRSFRSKAPTSTAGGAAEAPPQTPPSGQEEGKGTPS